MFVLYFLWNCKPFLVFNIFLVIIDKYNLSWKTNSNNHELTPFIRQTHRPSQKQIGLRVKSSKQSAVRLRWPSICQVHLWTFERIRCSERKDSEWSYLRLLFVNLRLKVDAIILICVWLVQTCFRFCWSISKTRTILLEFCPLLPL